MKINKQLNNCPSRIRDGQPLNQLTQSQNWGIDLVLLFTLLCLFYALFLGSHPLFTPDEGRYSEVAREMVASGDYITPRVNGIIFLDKPILYYWLQAIAIKVFGLHEYALRFWPAILGIFCCLMTYISGRFLFDRRTGLLSAIVLSTTLLFYAASHFANLDLEVASLISMSLLSFLMATKPSPYRLRLLIMGYVFSGMAVLTKGLIGVAFPLLILGAWMLILRRLNFLLQMKLILGFVIFSLIVIPWYILEQRATPEFFHYFFVVQQASRFLSAADFNNKAVFWFYIPIIYVSFFPWALFAVQSIWSFLKRIYFNLNAADNELFLVLWFFIITIFFSIPHSKTVGYILPVFPALALITGKYLSEQWEKKSLGLGSILAVSTYFVVGFIILLVCCLAVYYHQYLEINQELIPFILFFGNLFFVSGVIVYIIRKKSFKHLFTAFAVTAALTCLTINASSTALNHKTMKPLSGILNPHLRQDDEVITYYRYFQDLPLYLQRQVFIVADWHAKDILQNDNWLREMWYGMQLQSTHDWLLDDAAFWQQHWFSQKRVFVIIHRNHFNEFNAVAKDKFFKLGEMNDVILVSNQPA